jgi:hypothetical protein
MTFWSISSDTLILNILCRTRYHIHPTAPNNIKRRITLCLIGEILVERKSLKVKHETWLRRINTVTKEQGDEYIIFGEFGLNALFRKLGDPEKAKGRFAKLSLNQFEKRVKEARDKFREHAAATGILAASRVVIVSEDGDAALTSDAKLVEWFMGQLFLRSTPVKDKVGLINSILYIRDPAHTILGDGGTGSSG